MTGYQTTLMNDIVKFTDIDDSIVSKYIPYYVNALFNENVFNATSLTEFRDAFRLKQMVGKAWIMQNLNDVDKNNKILVIGSWLGYTSFCLWKLGFTNITECDPDTRVEIIAKHLNRFNTNFKHITDDVNNVDMSEYDVIINTSCEHIADDSWFHKINKHALVILHSTNLKADDHYNTCNSLIEMTNKYPMDYRYTGELLLDTYSRYMVIGYVL